MKKIITTLTFLLLSVCLFAQTKNRIRYFYYTVEFSSSDGCKHDQFGKYITKNQNRSADFDFIFKSMQNYVTPFKIDKKTFHLTEYKQISRKEWLIYKPSKFNACKDTTTFYKFSTVSNFSTNYFITPSTIIWHTNSLVAFDGKDEILNVSSPDSSGMYTVTFSKKVHFINDTTFTFKIKHK